MNKKVKNNSLLSKFLNDKKSRIRCKSGNSLRSDTPEFARLILFDFLSKISIRNSFIFYFSIEILILQQSLFLCQLAYISKNSLSNILYLFLPILSSFLSFTKSLRTLEREGLSTPKNSANAPRFSITNSSFSCFLLT